MEQGRQLPDQAPQQPDSAFQEVILEPIEDLGLPKKPKRSSAAAKRKKRRRQRRIMIAVGAVGVALLTVLIIIFVGSQQRIAAEAAAQVAAEEALRQQQEQDRLAYEQLVNSTVFLQGITVNGVSIGGMTMDEAKAALAAEVANVTAQRVLQLVYDNKLYPLDLSTMPSTVNTDSVLDEAYKLGKSGGDYATLKAEVDDVSTNGREFTLTISYDLSALTAAVAQIATQIDVAAVNASVTDIDKDTHALVIKDEVVGHAVDQTSLLTLITDAILNGSKTPINIPVVETQPTTTKAMLQGQYVKRASMTTDFSSSPSTRKYNVRKGAGIINGTVLQPGETFSTNDTLGVRSAGNGWKEANAYESGAVVPQFGGGVCQLSTTLYNAVVKADLEVVYRRNHSMPVGYIDKGLDATINSVGNIIDFQFKNNTSGEIIIIGYTSSSNKLTFEIWGLPFATTEYDEIKLTSTEVSSNSIDGEPVTIEVPVGTEKADGTLMVAGETYVAVAARKGYVYQSYKNYYKAGTLVKKEKLAVSTYKAFQGEIWTCLVAETPTPAPANTPEVFIPDATAAPTPTPVPTAIPATPEPVATP